MKSLNKYSLNVKQDPLSFQGSVQTEISRRSSNSSTERIEEVFSFNTNQKTIVDYERQLMQQRTELFMQVWRNPLLYQEFIEFMTFSKSPIFIGVLNGLQTLFIFLPVLTFQIKNNYSSRITSILVVIEIIVGISAALSGWLLYFCITENSYLHNIGKLWFQWNTRSDWKQITGRVQLITYVCVVLRHGIALIRRTLTGTCVNPSLLYSWTCNPQSSSHIFPLDSACISMLIPIFFCVVYREARIEVNIAAWLTVLFCLTTSCIILNSLQPVVMLLVYVALSIVIMIDAFQQYLLFFWLGRQLKKTLEANQKLAEQNKASDMRNIIANVAHDLKTPLSSFMTGVDIIAADLNEFQARIESTLSDCDIEQSKNDFPTLTPEYISTFASGLQSCIANIRNTNAFMLMTINRCLDYTKASNGLKLVPKNETIDLAETLKMPLQCMTNIQQKIKICLMPYGEQGICSHVITDKQWLQENVLCLLSNAVKYSAGGEVVIKVSKLSKSAQFVDGLKLPFSAIDVLTLDSSNYSILDMAPKTPGLGLVSPQVRVTPTSDINESDSLDELVRVPSTIKPQIELDRSFTIPHGNDGDQLMFEVIDTGTGMSEEAMKTLFNPFKQTQRLGGGTGLGLYSLAKRIEALKGKYGVHQREDGKQGSVFWFTVPYKPDSSKMVKDVHVSTPVAESLERIVESCFPDFERPQDPSLSILIAEDAPSIAKMTTMMLRRRNHLTEVAENGQIVLDLLYPEEENQLCRFDVVLMDLQMPVMDGLEATRRIRDHEREMASKTKNYHHHQIVIGVSANSDHETMEEALKAGIDDFLPKPFSVDDFLDVVKRIQAEWKY